MCSVGVITNRVIFWFFIALSYVILIWFIQNLMPTIVCEPSTCVPRLVLVRVCKLFYWMFSVSAKRRKRKNTKKKHENSNAYISGTAEVIQFKFGVWPSYLWGHYHRKFGFIQTKPWTYICMKMATLFFLSIYYLHTLSFFTIPVRKDSAITSIQQRIVAVSNFQLLQV